MKLSKSKPIGPDSIILKTRVRKGIKKYFFDSEGNYSDDIFDNDNCVFICCAKTDINAILKYNKWLKNSYKK